MWAVWLLSLFDSWLNDLTYCIQDTICSQMCEDYCRERERKGWGRPGYWAWRLTSTSVSSGEYSVWVCAHLLPTVGHIVQTLLNSVHLSFRILIRGTRTANARYTHTHCSILSHIEPDLIPDFPLLTLVSKAPICWWFYLSFCQIFLWCGLCFF